MEETHYIEAKIIRELCQVHDLVEILKSAEDTLDLFRELLAKICKRFPAQDSSQDGTFVRVSNTWGSHKSSVVSPDGFIFLEVIYPTYIPGLKITR